MNLNSRTDLAALDSVIDTDPDTEGMSEFRRVCAGVIEADIYPHIEQWNRDGGLSKQAFKDFSRAGLMNLMTTDDRSWQANRMQHSEILVEEMMRYPLAGVMTSILAQTHTVLPLIAELGTPEQRAKYLEPSLRGELVSGIAITDPGGGSDLVRSIEAKARATDNGWELNGEKMFITNSPIADFLVVLARTDESRGALGMTLFIVDTTTPGFSVTKRLDKLGLHASPTGRLKFDQCQLPSSAVLGRINDGFPKATAKLSNERLLIAVCALAMAKQCVQRAEAHGLELNDERSDLTVLKIFVHDLIASCDAGDLRPHDIAAAKFMSAELVQQVTLRCQQMPELLFDDFLTQSFRDARVLGIFAGTSETMKEYYSTRMTLGRGLDPLPDY